jgi:Xaa-Pro aminopeptidase
LRGKPLAVIPEIGADYMGATWIEEIRTWPAPVPEDEGVSLLALTLQEVVDRSGTVGMPMGPETHLRMPLADFELLRSRLQGISFVDATTIIRTLRLRKSDAEIAKIKHICDIVTEAFAALPQLVADGDTEEEVFRAFKVDVLRRGADDVPYLVVGAGPGGYAEIISPPSTRPLQAGDVLMLDTGSVFDGYYCDFDRNFAIGHAAAASQQAYELLFRATDAGLRAARPGVTCADLYNRMRRELAAGGSADTSTGRLGHGLGMQLTEWPSLTVSDETMLHPGMVLTLEPGITIGPGQMMVHEENIVIRDGGAELLTHRAPPALPVL